MSNSLVEATSKIVERSLKENTATRVPCVLVLDRSGSMSEYGKIDKLNSGLRVYADELRSHELACKMVETAIVEFGPVQVSSPFITADEFIPPTLTADGTTPMGAAILRSIELMDDRLADYKSNGIQYYRPWIILITDGMPDEDDPIHQAINAVRAGVAAKRFVFHAIGIGEQGTDFDILQQLSPEAKTLANLKFTELFTWLSTSMSTRASSMPSQKIAYEPVSSWTEETL